MPNRKGFTLIELLVVVAIIALLVSILAPSLNEARKLAEQTLCLTKVKQWALGFTLYNTDYGTLPGVIGGWATPEEHKSHYIHSMGPYLGYDFDAYGSITTDLFDFAVIPPAWRCPSAEKPPSLNTDWLAYSHNWTIIGYMNNLQVYGPPWGHKPFRIADFTRPSQTMVMIDSNGGAIYPPFPPMEYMPDMDYDGDGLPANYSGNDTNTTVFTWKTADFGYDYPYNGIAARHMDRMANAAFLDGHAEPKFIADMMDPDNRHWGRYIWDE